MPHSLASPTDTGAIFLSAVERASAQSENVQRIQRHDIGVRARVRRGLVANAWPYGYRAIRDATGRNVGAEFDEAEIGAVHLATQMYLSGAGYGEITLALRDSHYRPRRSQEWHQASVRDIVQNDIYAGYVEYDGTRNMEPSGLYPAVWDEATYHAVLRERTSRTCGGKPPATAVSGLVICERCGWAMGYDRRRGRDYSEFRCNRQRSSHINGRCHANGIHLSAVLDAVDELLASYRELSRSELEQLVDAALPAQSELEQQRQQARAAMSEAQRRLERLALAVAAGTIDARAARSANEVLVGEYDGARAELRAIDEQLAALPGAGERLAAVQAMLDAVPAAGGVRGLPAPAARRVLLDAGVRIWVDAGEIVRREIGAL